MFSGIMTRIEDIRKFYARLMAANAGSPDPRLEAVFAEVPREAFLGPGPWMIIAGNGKVTTTSADPTHIYQTGEKTQARRKHCFYERSPPRSISASPSHLRHIRGCEEPRF
ncbi:hypothetical protein ASD99_08140 [Mesorhizobium sp. Root695]|nr:hypothetical protein ASD99_08140 [Mesorhizobium sp. Root695]